MKYLIEYISKLLKTWIFYLGLIPAFYDFINTYFNWKFEFSSKFLLFWALFCVLYGSFEVWKKEKENFEKLLEKYNQLKNSFPNYEVKIFLRKYKFKEIEEFKQKKKEYLQRAYKQLEILGNKVLLEKLSVKEIEKFFDFIPYEKKYNLAKYENDLRDFIKNLEILDVKNDLKNINFYKATLEISNIGNKSDEDIFCEINVGEKNFTFEDLEDAENVLNEITNKNIPKLSDFPKPEIIKETIPNNLNNLSKLQRILNQFNRPIQGELIVEPIKFSGIDRKLIKNLHPPFFSCEEHIVTVRKLSLKVGLVYTKDFYLILNDSKNISYFITSKYLPSPLENRVKVIYEI